MEPGSEHWRSPGFPYDEPVTQLVNTDRAPSPMWGPGSGAVTTNSMAPQGLCCPLERPDINKCFPGEEVLRRAQRPKGHVTTWEQASQLSFHSRLQIKSGLGVMLFPVGGEGHSPLQAACSESACNGSDPRPPGMGW